MTPQTVRDADRNAYPASGASAPVTGTVTGAAEPAAVARLRRQVNAAHHNTAPERTQIDGAELLSYVQAFLRHFAHWPTEAALTTATLWIAQAHGRHRETKLPVWLYSPRLFFTSTEPGSGKSWMGRLVAALSPSGKRLIEPTKPSLIQLIGERHTVQLTEADLLFGSGGRNRGIVAVVNAGYEPDGSTTRMRGRQAEEVCLYGPMVIDGLDTLIKATGPDLRALVSRCLIVHVNRAPDGYRPPRLDEQAGYVGTALRDRLALWMAQQVEDGIAKRVPELPDGLGNRPAALWEPLFAVADAAGGDWPVVARCACRELESALGQPDDVERWVEVGGILESWGVT